MQIVKYLAPLALAMLSVAVQAQAYRPQPQQSQQPPQRDLRTTLRSPYAAVAVDYPRHLSAEQRAELRRQLSQQNRQEAVRH